MSRSSNFYIMLFFATTAALAASPRDAAALTFGFQESCWEGPNSSRPFTPILEKPRTLFTVDMRVCETEDTLAMVVYSTNTVEGGKSINFDWATEYWNGNISLSVLTDFSSFPRTGSFTAEGVVQHSTPPGADEFEWSLEQEGVKDSRDRRAIEPQSAVAKGTVDHGPGNDGYYISFRINPEVTFFGGQFPNPAENQLAWLIEIYGQHGGQAPQSGHVGIPRGPIFFPRVGNDFNDDFGPPVVPLPATGWLMLMTVAAVLGLKNKGWVGTSV
ncbi:MAG: hypothetical protein ABJD13_15215 [Paracoccaceae bacterium]